MKVRLTALAALLCLISNLALAAQGPRTKAKNVDKAANVGQKARGARLVPMLPATDGIVTIDAKRLGTEGLPRLLAANPALLGKITQHLDDIRNKTGIDLRKFDEVALGLKLVPKGAKGVNTYGVALASGDINAGAFVAVAKLAANGAYRQETVAGRAVYVFTAKGVANRAGANASGTSGLVGDLVDHMTASIAVAAYDANLLLVGSEPLVRETLTGNTHPNTELTALLNRNPAAIVNFALKTPAGFEGMLPLGNDELGKNLRAIQYLSGSADETVAGASLRLAARTAQPDQAQGLKATLDGLQMMGTALLGGSTKPANQVYSRLLKGAKFTQTGSEVTLDLLVPQADIDTLVSGLK
jgi:hypothetical protein